MSATRPPQRIPPVGTPPRTGRRVYAHVERLACACPRCGAISLPPKKARASLGYGYHPETGIFRCYREKCGYIAYVGVIFWPRGAGRAALPPDHVLLPGEAASLRLALSYAETRRNDAPRLADAGGGVGQRRTQPVNRVCTCGECPIHGEDL